MIAKPDVFMPITEAEFKAQKLSPFTRQVLALKPGAAFRLKCRWVHGATCHGGQAAGTVARRAGFHVRASCRDGWLRVWRPAKEA